MDDELLGDSLESPRLEERLRLLGTRLPRCSHPGCTETDPFALTGVDPHVLCAEHRADAEGKSWTQGHHVSARANDPQDVRAIPANDHAVVTLKHQSEWPRETLRNPDGSPLLQAAASLRGWLDMLRLVLERSVGWVPDLLERLDSWLRERIGPRWWEEFRSGGDAQ